MTHDLPPIPPAPIPPESLSQSFNSQSVNRNETIPESRFSFPDRNPNQSESRDPLSSSIGHGIDRTRNPVSSIFRPDNSPASPIHQRQRSNPERIVPNPSLRRVDPPRLPQPRQRRIPPPPSSGASSSMLNGSYENLLNSNNTRNTNNSQLGSGYLNTMEEPQSEEFYLQTN
jgi:hypothetical protein